MDADESIAKLAARLDKWLDGSFAVFASQDRAAQARAIDRGIAIVKELERLKESGIAAITKLLSHPTSNLVNNQIESLTRAFEFSSRLAAALHDELLDTDAENKIWGLMDTMVRALDQTGRGRAVLDILLENPDARVRGAAGSYLIDLMPEKVIPILRKIAEEDRGSSAAFGAHWTLLAWERERQSRFKSLSRGDTVSSPD